VSSFEYGARRAETADLHSHLVARRDDDHRPNAPLSTISPARSGSRYSMATRASRSRAISGSPRHALPSPLETSWPFTVRLIVTSTGSTSSNPTASSETTNSPLDALSAAVSAMRMSHPAMRLSTISMAAWALATAARTFSRSIRPSRSARMGTAWKTVGHGSSHPEGARDRRCVSGLLTPSSLSRVIVSNEYRSSSSWESSDSMFMSVSHDLPTDIGY
jgi:hypothetical protein